MPKEIIGEVHDVFEEAIFENNWSEHSLLVMDNRRILHGRRKFNVQDEGSRPLVFQTLTTKFDPKFHFNDF